MVDDLVKIGRGPEGESVAFFWGFFTFGQTPKASKFPKTVVLPLQVDLEQLGHLLQVEQNLETGNIFQIF